MVVETRPVPVVIKDAVTAPKGRRFAELRDEPSWRPGDPITREPSVQPDGSSSSEGLGATKASVRASTGKE